MLVLKDNLAARAFNVPLAWFTHLGTLLGVLTGFCVLASFLAVKFWYGARHGDPGRVHALEDEISSLRRTNGALESRAAQADSRASQATAAAAAAAQGAAQTQAKSSAPSPVPVPTVTVTVTPTAAAPAPAPAVPAAPAAPAAPARPSGPMDLASRIFAALPAGISPPPPARELAIAVDSPTVRWNGRSLKVHFNLQYVKSDGASQQGRIVMLARGPDAVLAYPDGVLNPAGRDSLIVPEQGEYFSVGRFREVSAEFGQLPPPHSIREIEVYLFGQSGDNPPTRLLIHQVLPVEGRPAASPLKATPRRSTPAAKPKRAAPRAADSAGAEPSAADDVKKPTASENPAGTTGAGAGAGDAAAPAPAPTAGEAH